MTDVFIAKGLFGREDVVFSKGQDETIFISTSDGRVIAVKEESLIEYAMLLKHKVLS